MQKDYVVIGYGNWSKKIINLNQRINKNYKLNGIFYRSRPKDQFYKNNKKIFYKDWKKMVNTLIPSTIVICLPPSLNVQVLNYLRRKKFIKKILVEKPLCTSEKDNKFLKNLETNFKKKIFVNYLDIHSKSLSYLINENINFNKIIMHMSGPSTIRKDMTPFWEYSPHFFAFLILKIKDLNKYKISCDVKELKLKKFVFRVKLLNKNKSINLICGNHTHRKFRKITLINKNSNYNYNDRNNNQLTLIKNNKRYVIFKNENLLNNTLLFFFNNFLENKKKYKSYNYVDISFKINKLMLSIEKVLYK